ncbi:Endonuclease/exonuclease/phosphatase [Trema orientale]|uniref:Endonuclease/exonuclease/phosphatase n=1 Tax=Trema orientale TaxID=63057 RepID=A0A2P5AY65_TREOI|nr:Endonuclease/exonuclease/phosphatase [Trema orientale]
MASPVRQDRLPTTIFYWNLCTLSTLYDLARKVAPSLDFLSETRLAGGRAERINFQSAEGILWRFTGFYGNPKAHLRSFSSDLLRRLKSLNLLPWLYRGDFNKVLILSEKIVGGDRSVTSIVNFRKAIVDCDLNDLGFSGFLVTWNNKQESTSNIQERLDRFIGSSSWQSLFPWAHVEHGEFFQSDHCPIIVHLVSRLGGKAERGDFAQSSKSFKFESFWLKEDTC